MSEPVLEASIEFTVGEDDTAIAVGSGSLPVLGTPRLLAWCEAVTCAAIEPALAAGETSVGTRVALEHLAASPVGETVTVTASASYVDGRLHRFTVAARNPAGKVLGTGEVTRVVVNAERFCRGSDAPGAGFPGDPGKPDVLPRNFAPERQGLPEK